MESISAIWDLLDGKLENCYLKYAQWCVSYTNDAKEMHLGSIEIRILTYIFLQLY